ncbi:MAG: DUF4156 domain-containing protein [Labilithrix sp.]|nr:DUF4156 domain-containing protein [Labilithrix sp.]MCW5814141.1 DUF4156 domain-containing protein [Labilithrix sp.]
MAIRDRAPARALWSRAAIGRLELMPLMLVALAGCHRPALTPAGAAVVASTSPPAPSCERLADVHGRAGGVIEGSIVGLDKPGLAAYALNDLRNAAAAQGADYVYRSEPTFSAPYGHVTLADYNGYAYRCAK